MEKQKKIEWLQKEISYCERTINEYQFRKEIAEKEQVRLVDEWDLERAKDLEDLKKHDEENG